jgi:DNA repair protein RecN (Recombination protein N)
MVFDEIDSGIGGAISLIVGEKLFKISRKKQIIVISHLAQIACFSNSHYFIDKYVEDDRTKIKIDELDNPGKVQEISRMLGGSRDSQISLNHAGELIEKADQVKERLEKEILNVGN